jgi:hypothetical protein
MILSSPGIQLVRIDLAQTFFIPKLFLNVSTPNQKIMKRNLIPVSLFIVSFVLSIILTGCKSTGDSGSGGGGGYGQRNSQPDTSATGNTESTR